MFASFLTVAAMPVLTDATTPQTCAVLIDFGDGTVAWADVPIDSNTDSFNATKMAAEQLGLAFESINYPGMGDFVDKIGNKSSTSTEFWGFWVWNSTAQKWVSPMFGAQSPNAKAINFPAIAFKIGASRADWSSPAPLATPEHRYPWTVSKYDLSNSGNSPSYSSVTPGMAWSKNLNSGAIDTVPVSANGSLYVFAGDFMTKAKLFCMDLNGDQKWNATVNSTAFQLSSPLLIEGQVIVSTNDGVVTSFNSATGAKLWNFTIDSPAKGISSSPVFTSNMIIVPGGDGKLYALNEDGSLAWKKVLASEIYYSAPAVKDGTIYVGSTDGVFHAVATNGTELWNVSFGGKIKSSAALLNDSIVLITYTYAVSDYAVSSSNFVQMNYTGTIMSNISMTGKMSTPSILGKNVVVSYGNDIQMRKANGSLVWSTSIGATIGGSIAVSSNGILAITNEATSNIVMLSKTGVKMWNSSLLPANYALGSPIVVEDTVIAVCDNGYVYAYNNLDPVVNLTAVNDGLKVEFSAGIVDLDQCHVTWNFGDGNTSTGAHVNHTYEKAGSYTVTAWTVDAQGANTTVTKAISVESKTAATDNTMLYVLVASVVLVLLAVGAVYFVRRKK
jgi:outer membrane protein assembly factor BamB